MKLLDLIKLPEEETKDNITIAANAAYAAAAAAYDAAYAANAADRKWLGWNDCLSEIRKMNEGVVVGVDEEEIKEITLKIFGYPDDNRDKQMHPNIVIQRLDKFAKAIAQSLDKWLIVKKQ